MSISDKIQFDSSTTYKRMKAVAQRLPFLDTARGFAALGVIIWHCFTAIFNQIETSGIYTSPFHFFWYGQAAVIFFFIHSGFILSYSNARFSDKISGIDYIKYLVRRIFRIYPLFLSVLLLSYLLKIFLYPVPSLNYMSIDFMKFWSGPVHFEDLLKQGILIVRPQVEEGSTLVPQDWSLTIEMLICPFIPFLNFLNRRFRLLFWPLVILLIKIFHFNTYLFEFAVGVTLFQIRDNIKSLWDKSHWFARFTFLGFAIVLYTCWFGFPNIFKRDSVVFTPVVDRLMVVSGCTMFLILILNSKFVQKIFNLSWLVNIGKTCYSLYINHLFLLILFSNITLTILHQLVTGPDWLITFLFVLIFLLLSIFVSKITYKYIEKPFNTWGSKISDYLARVRIKSLRKNFPPVS